jgi:hypothetical protein
MPWNFTQGDVAAGWVRLGLLDLVAVVPEGLDAIGAFLGIKEALSEDRPSRRDALLYLSSGASP